MIDAATDTPSNRRRSDQARETSRRIGVLWSGDATTAHCRLPSIVLDISPEGAKLRADNALLGEIDSFKLAIGTMPPIDCTPVWQKDGRLGVRFVAGQPSMAELEYLVDPS